MSNMFHAWFPLTVTICLLIVACGSSQNPVEQFDRGNYESSFAQFQRLANEGDFAAQNYLGIHYYLGLGVERDFRKATQWFKQAALANHPKAQRNLGIMYLRGLGMRQDNTHAYGWLHRAYLQGNENSRNYLRLMSDMVTPNQIIKARNMIDDYLSAAKK